ncbi:F-box domain-containing protein [bacterium NHP-B]|nr:F-box domain-containing protein [bacterium NHP-B]
MNAMDISNPEATDGASITPNHPACAEKDTPFPLTLKGKVTPALIIPDSPDNGASGWEKASMLYITYKDDLCQIRYVDTPQELTALARAIQRQAGEVIVTDASYTSSQTLDDLFHWLITPLTTQKKIPAMPEYTLFINDPMALADPKHALNSQKLTHVIFTKSNRTPHRLRYLSAPLTSITYVTISKPLFWDVERFPKLNHVHTQASPFFFPGYFLNTSIVHDASWKNIAPSFAYAGAYVGYGDLGQQPRTGVKSHIAFFAHGEDPWGIGAQHCTVTYPGLRKNSSINSVPEYSPTNSAKINYWNGLPDEMVRRVIEILSGRDVIAFKNTCKRFERIVLGKRSNKKFYQDILAHTSGFDLPKNAKNALFEAPFVTISNNLEVRSKEGLFDCTLSLPYDQDVITQKNIRAGFNIHILSDIASCKQDQSFYQRIELTLFPGDQPQKKLLTVGPFYRCVLKGGDARLQLPRQLQLIMVASKLIADDWNAKTLPEPERLI